MTYIDIHTHQHYSDATEYIYNAFLEKNHLPARYSLGIHPWYVTQPARQLQQLQELLEQLPDTAFVGECGLDKLCDIPWDNQLQVFSAQIQLARRFHKPIIIHCVKAYQECLALLKGCEVPVVFHGFNKHVALARQIVSQGHYLSLGHGVVRHPERYTELLQQISLQYILLETDQCAVPVATVYTAVASILKIEPDDVILQIQKNYTKIINF